MANPAVHDRGRGYSNSFTLCRGGTLSPQHLIHPSGTALNNHTQYADNQPKPFNYIPQYRHLPYELGLPVMANRQSGTAQAFQVPLSFHFLMEAAFGITPMALVQREPILRYISFQLSPTQIQVLWLYGKIGMVSHPNPTISFCQSHHVIQQSYSPSKLSIECSIILRFSSHLDSSVPIQSDQDLSLALATSHG